MPFTPFTGDDPDEGHRAERVRSVAMVEAHVYLYTLHRANPTATKLSITLDEDDRLRNLPVGEVSKARNNASMDIRNDETMTPRELMGDKGILHGFLNRTRVRYADERFVLTYYRPGTPMPHLLSNDDPRMSRLADKRGDEPTA